MRITTSRRGLRAAIAAGATLGTAGTASAQLPVLGDPQQFLDTALTQEGCDYPGILVPVIAQFSRDAVLGCGHFEDDPPIRAAAAER